VVLNPAGFNFKMLPNSPLLSPDRKQLYYNVTYADEPKYGASDIAMVDRDDAGQFTNPRVLSGAINSDRPDSPAWLSPDGNTLITSAQDGLRIDYYLSTKLPSEANFGDRKPYRLFANGRQITRPWISPDGRRMYFNDHGNNAKGLFVAELQPKKTP
jgi:hypothetical protein